MCLNFSKQQTSQFTSGCVAFACFWAQTDAEKIFFSGVFINLKNGISLLAAFACPPHLPVALSGIFHPSAAAAADTDADADGYDMLLGWKVKDHWLGHNSWQMMMLLAWTDLLTTPASP